MWGKWEPFNVILPKSINPTTGNSYSELRGEYGKQIKIFTVIIEDYDAFFNIFIPYIRFKNTLIYFADTFLVMEPVGVFDCGGIILGDSQELLVIAAGIGSINNAIFSISGKIRYRQ